MQKLLEGRVVIVTGAGAGLGRAYTFALAQQGAKVVVNDIAGDDADSPAGRIVEEIRRNGGEAVAVGGDVTSFSDMQAVAARATETWGRIDGLVCNAGILRDKSFTKLSLEDFAKVLDVHVMGSVHAIKAVWDGMRAQGYGRIVLTTSSSGLFGNFGQSNYAAAKMALVGLMQTLALEGASKNVRVNCIAPIAATGMTEGVLTPESLQRLAPAAVSPAVIALLSEQAPTRQILLAGGGSLEASHITMTRGIHLGDAIHNPDAAAVILQRLQEIADRESDRVPGTGFEQCQWELEKAGFHMDLPGK